MHITAFGASTLQIKASTGDVEQVKTLMRDTSIPYHPLTEGDKLLVLIPAKSGKKALAALEDWGFVLEIDESARDMIH